jgi:hypothetical protein
MLLFLLNGRFQRMSGTLSADALGVSFMIKGTGFTYLNGRACFLGMSEYPTLPAQVWSRDEFFNCEHFVDDDYFAGNIVASKYRVAMVERL